MVASLNISDNGSGGSTVTWAASHSGLWAGRNTGSGPVDWQFYYCELYECNPANGAILFTHISNLAWSGTLGLSRGYGQSGLTRMRAFYYQVSNPGNVQYLDDVVANWSTGPAPVNNAPTISNLGANNVTTNSATVFCTYSDAEGANGSVLFRWSTDPNFGSYTDAAQPQASPGSDVSATLFGLPAGSTIYVRAFGHDGAQFGAPAQIQFNTAAPVTQTQFPSISVTAMNETTILITAEGSRFSDGSGVGIMDVYNTTTGAYVGRIFGSSGSINESGLTPGRGYSYRVDTWDSSFSVNYDQLFGSANTPSLPADVFLTGQRQPTSNILTWTASSNYSHYELYRDNLLLATLPFGTASYTDSGMAAGVQHSYKIRARNSDVTPALFSAYSNVVTLRTNSPPSNPGAVTVTPNPVDGVGTLNWVASTDPDNDAITYTLELSRDNGSTWAVLTSGISPGASFDFSATASTPQARIRITARDSNNATNPAGPVLGPAFVIRHSLAGGSALAASSSLSADGKVATDAGLLTLTGTTSLVALGLAIWDGAANLIGNSALNTDPKVVRYGVVTMAADSTMEGNPALATALLDAVATLSGDGSNTVVLTQVLSAEAALTTEAWAVYYNTLTLSAQASLTDQAILVVPALADLVATATMTARYSVLAAAGLFADATLDVAPVVGFSGMVHYYDPGLDDWPVKPALFWDGTGWVPVPIMRYDPVTRRWRKVR